VANKSVEAFRKLTIDMQRQILVDAVGELNVQADQLVTTMKSVVKHGPTGNLANSIRKAPGAKVTIVRVMAGGSTTTRKGSGGKPAYDYARAVEFGTLHMPAESFFFPTFRLMRKPMRSSMRRKISKTINRYSAE
jgi:HK97 gp10 family phage protein